MDIPRIINKIRPGAAWSMSENSYESLQWKDTSPKPSLEEIYAAQEQVMAEIEKEKAEALRKAAYQEEADPLYFEFQRGDATKQEWLDKIAEIKDRFPYPANSQT